MTRKNLLILLGIVFLIIILTYRIWTPYFALLISGDLFEPEQEVTSIISPVNSSETTSVPESEEVLGPGTFKDDELGFSFNYSNWWTFQDSWDAKHDYYLTLNHNIPGGDGPEGFGDGDSKIQINLGTFPSFTQDPSLDKFTETIIKGQKAYTSGGDGFLVSHVYYIEIPSHPGTYLGFSIYGHGTQKQLDEVIGTLKWTK